MVKVPSKHAIKSWIKNSEEPGSAPRKKPTGQDSQDVAASNGGPQRQTERMHEWRRTPSTGRNFQTLIICNTVS
jgi:hypothetical protein